MLDWSHLPMREGLQRHASFLQRALRPARLPAPDWKRGAGPAGDRLEPRAGESRPIKQRPAFWRNSRKSNELRQRLFPLAARSILRIQRARWKPPDPARRPLAPTTHTPPPGFSLLQQTACWPQVAHRFSRPPRISDRSPKRRPGPARCGSGARLWWVLRSVRRSPPSRHKHAQQRQIALSNRPYTFSAWRSQMYPLPGPGDPQTHSGRLP